MGAMRRMVNGRRKSVDGGVLFRKQENGSVDFLGSQVTIEWRWTCCIGLIHEYGGSEEKDVSADGTR